MSWAKCGLSPVGERSAGIRPSEVMQDLGY
jgi:hypothetical protein